jgi:hypothetical protein
MAIPSNWITMEAEIYGMIPRAKMEALENAPPVNMLSNPSKPLEVWLWSWASIFGSTPGNTT